MTRYRVPGPDEMDPDWGVDPEVDAHFPDDATIARELEEDRRRLLPAYDPDPDISTMFWMIFLALLMAWLVWTMTMSRQQWRQWVGLVQAGGGEVHHLITETRCRTRPLLPRRQYLGQLVQIGTTVEVVARANDWALIDRYGHPCWVPSWALSRTAPDVRAIRKCGRSCYPGEPAGWAAAQRQAACRSNVMARVRCLVDSLFD